MAKTPAGKDAPITIKKYANRRLYNTETSSYVTLDNLSQMVKDGKEFTLLEGLIGSRYAREGGDDDEIVKALGGKKKVGIYTGAVSDGAAQKAKADFLSGKLKVLVATMARRVPARNSPSPPSSIGRRPTRSESGPYASWPKAMPAR